MASVTNVELQRLQAVEVLSEGAWWRGVVTDVDKNRERPYLVHFDVHGVGDEDWFDPASVKASPVTPVL